MTQLFFKALTVLIVFIAIVNLYNCSEQNCPEKHFLKGCSCEPNTLSIVCQNDDEVPDFERLYGYNFTKITFKNSVITKVPLSNAYCNELVLIDNEKLEDFDALFRFAPKKLTLINNLKFDEDSFRNLFQHNNYALDELKIEDHAENTPMENLQFSFGNFKQLTTVSLKHNGIKSLGSRIFEENDKLKNVDLSINNIEYLANNSLKFSGKLKYQIELNLHYNRINNKMLLDSNLSSYEGEMKIDLSNNIIEDLSQNPYNFFCKRNTLIELGGNHLKCEVNTINWLISMRECRLYLKFATCFSSGENIFDYIDKMRTTENPATKNSTIKNPHTENPTTMMTPEPGIFGYPILKSIVISKELFRSYCMFFI